MDSPLPGTQAFTVRLQPQELQDRELQYWFDFELTDGSTFSYPDEALGGEPYTLKTEIQSGKEDVGFVLLSTEEDFAQKGEYVLVVSYFAIADQIDPATIEVWVNGRNVTSLAVITENLLSYRDPKPKTKNYEAVVTALDRQGKLIKSQVFTTLVDPKGGRIKIYTWGGVNFASNFHRYRPQEEYEPNQPEDPKNSYAGWLDFNIRYKQLKLNLNALHSSLENPNRQPIDRYCAGLQLGFLTIQAGDQIPQLSPLAMSNKTIRGLYGSLKGQYIGLELTGGEMVRKTIAGGDPDTYTAFRQQALGGKLSLGTERGLLMSLTLARNRDVINSLNPEDYISYDPETADTLFVVAPQDNLVASFDTRINIPALNTNLGVEVAGSLYNRNTWPGPISAEEISQYLNGFDYIDPADLAEVFVINRNMEPILPGLPNCAARAWLRTNFLNNIISVDATATGPVYHALSTWGQKPDTKTVTFSDMFNIGRSFYLSGVYIWQQDNLFGTSASTNTNRIWHLQGTLRLLKYFSLRGSYFNSDATNDENTAVGEGLVFMPCLRNSHYYTVGAGFNNPRVDYLPYFCELNYRNGTDFSNTIQFGEYRNSTNSINFSLLSKFGRIPLRLQVNASLATLANDLSEYIPVLSFNYISYHARISYSLFKDKLIPWLQYRRSDYNIANKGDKCNDFLSLGLEAFPWKNMSVNTSLNRMTNVDKSNSNLKHQTITWSLTLGQRF
ncbi:MAG TPA: hypothetical protein PKI63_09155 [Candidatus Cloacimonadota bacterium]|nr:hypothetical protein [Candidatus Cloacimonadota bacterium]